MRHGMLIDAKGRPWSDASWDLVRRIGFHHPSLDLAGFAVRERGFIHIRAQDGGARVALRSGGFGLEALAGALYELKERRFRRIILAIFAEGEWAYEMLGSTWEFADRAEHLLDGGPVRVLHPWLAAERDLAALSLPTFAAVQPIVALWREAGARYCEELPQALKRAGMLSRAVLLRRPPNSSRLLVEHFGSGIRIRRPCESLLAVGRDFEDMPDRAYGDWAARAYSEALAEGHIRLESVRAVIATSEAATLRIRYDRLLMPCRSAGSDAFILGLSLRRELSVA